jgi:outer membrane lipoprotein-sorting protein
MKTIWAVLAALSVLCCIAKGQDASSGPVVEPRPVLQELQHKMSEVRSLYLEFTQERHLKLFTEPLKSEGVMLLERAGSIRWETTAPYESILLGNPKSVAQFENNDGEWKKLKLGFPQLLRRVMEQIALIHQGKIDALTNDFGISVEREPEDIVVKLIPKEATISSMMSSLVVKLRRDFSATREVLTYEPGGDFTRIIFNRERHNVTFPPGTFDQGKPLDIATVRAAIGP